MEQVEKERYLNISRCRDAQALVQVQEAGLVHCENTEKTCQTGNPQASACMSLAE
jgi:hypothetical protein